MTESLGEVAAIIHRLAVLLTAGVAPVSAWRHVAVGARSAVPAAAAASGPAGIPGAIVAAATGGDASARQAWRGLAAAWAVATDAGAPLAPSLTSYASSLRALADAQRDVRVAPAVAARLRTRVAGHIARWLYWNMVSDVVESTPVGPAPWGRPGEYRVELDWYSPTGVDLVGSYVIRSLQHDIAFGDGTAPRSMVSTLELARLINTS